MISPDHCGHDRRVHLSSDWETNKVDHRDHDHIRAHMSSDWGTTRVGTTSKSASICVNSTLKTPLWPRWPQLDVNCLQKFGTWKCSKIHVVSHLSIFLAFLAILRNLKLFSRISVVINPKGRHANNFKLFFRLFTWPTKQIFCLYLRRILDVA